MGCGASAQGARYKVHIKDRLERFLQRLDISESECFEIFKSFEKVGKFILLI